VSAPRPSISVIVLTYSARQFVSRCLTALLAQTQPDFEVIVVDNASPDRTAAFVRDQFPSVRVVEAAANDGYGAGNNLGARHAAGDVLVFLNPDAVPDVDWLENLISVMQDRGSRFATSCITLQSDTSRLNSSGNLVHYLGLSFCRGLNERRSRFDAVEYVSGASGAACAISRDVFEWIGGFDPTFFLYHDDVDLSVRALLAGVRCLYVPKARVAHDYELSVPPVKWGWVEAHRYAVLLKAFRFRTLMLLLPALLAIDLVTFAYLALRGRAFVSAKLRSYGWVAHHLPTIWRGRRRAQSVRVIADRDLLSILADHVPYEQLAPPVIADGARLLVDPWFRIYRRLLLSIISW
jgi:GT2 family glycosyltransferase